MLKKLDSNYISWKFLIPKRLLKKFLLQKNLSNIKIYFKQQTMKTFMNGQQPWLISMRNKNQLEFQAISLISNFGIQDLKVSINDNRMDKKIQLEVVFWDILKIKSDNNDCRNFNQQTKTYQSTLRIIFLLDLHFVWWKVQLKLANTQETIHWKRWCAHGTTFRLILINLE